MTHAEITERTRAILAKVLGIGPAKITDDASSVDLVEWDSLRHMNVILSLENEFDIEFEDTEIRELHSVSLLAAAIARHRDGK